MTLRRVVSEGIYFEKAEALATTRGKYFNPAETTEKRRYFRYAAIYCCISCRQQSIAVFPASGLWTNVITFVQGKSLEGTGPNDSSFNEFTADDEKLFCTPQTIGTIRGKLYIRRVICWEVSSSMCLHFRENILPYVATVLVMS